MKQLWRNSWQLTLAILLALTSSLFTAPLSAPVFAHGGGTPRLTAVPTGPYRLYAWSDPEPWRVGQVHLSLAVTKPNPDTSSNQVEMPVTDVDITVTYIPMRDNAVDPTAEPVVVKAVRQEFLSDFYYEADPVLNRQGDWQINVEVTGPDGTGSTQFPMEIFPARTLNWTLIGGGVAVLVVLVILMAMWSRSQQPAQPVRRPHRGVRRAKGQSRPVERKEA